MQTTQAETTIGGTAALARAWSTLVALSFRRLLWSVNTLMVMLPLLGCVLFVFLRRANLAAGAAADFESAFGRFSHFFVIVIFSAFVVPVCSLAYATTSIGGDREDRTLLFLLVRPVPRWLILLAKLCATLPLVLGLLLGTFYACCQLAGPVGRTAFPLYGPAVAYMALAYVGLFHLFAVCFRHSTILAVIYGIFMELVLGNLPGIVKRVAVNYYGRSLIFAAGAEHGLRPFDERLFEILPSPTARAALLAIAAGSVLLALAVFQRKEYRDLT